MVEKKKKKMVDRDESKVRTFTGNEAKQKVSRCSADRARTERCYTIYTAAAQYHTARQLVPFFFSTLCSLL